MTISVIHTFVSAKADGSDTTLVQPSDWNDQHTISLAAGKILGRDTSGAGAVQELPLAFTAAYEVTLPLTTGSMIGAKGTTAQRPGSPVAGMERWNTTTVAKEIHNGTSWLALLAAGAITSFAPTGRITLETGVPVSSTDQAGKATIYYTPAGVGYAQYPSYDGTNWSVIAFSELSNDTTASATNNAGAAAAGPYQIQDCFVWSNAGTNRLTRGPKWTASATATMTIAVPGVVTWTAHGLWDGATVRFTTTGALPTGLAVNTDYFVTKVDANTFKLSTTLANQVAGTFITTSGSQSGVHTVFNYTSVRGTGAATTELQLLNGVYVNKYDITNGPLATKGTYVGSVYFNASSQIDLKFGSVAAGYGEAFIGVWNAYNQAKVSGTVGTSTASWGVSSSQKVFNSSASARVSAISGLATTPLCCHVAGYITCDGATSIGISVAFRALTGANPNITQTYVNAGSSNTPYPLHLEYKSVPFLGAGYVVPIDYSTNYTSTYINNNGTTSSYIDYDWRY